MASEPIYVDLASESEDPRVTEIESLCLKCQGRGMTRLLLTKIPHYKEIIITSFECYDCGDKNTGIQKSSIEDSGVKYELKVETLKDLSRQIVKSDKATIRIVELDFEVPPNKEKGEITTVEGVILKAIHGLSQEQETRKELNVQLYEKIKLFLIKLEDLIEVHTFTVLLNDPSGNSIIENLHNLSVDPQLKTTIYSRTKAQSQTLGFGLENEDENESSTVDKKELDPIPEKTDLKEEVLQFNTICDQCSRPSSTKMKVTAIPHFKEVVIMATECDGCGFRTNEVKSGSGVEPLGKKYNLHLEANLDEIKHKENLARDLLKSETCAIIIPELDITVGAGIVVGKFTTVEGLLIDVKDDISSNPFMLGDAAEKRTKTKVQKLVDDIQKILDGQLDGHLILDDPAGNSMLQDIYTPKEDPFLEVESYVRSFDQNEELGLNDMKTENYA